MRRFLARLFAAEPRSGTPSPAGASPPVDPSAWRAAFADAEVLSSYPRRLQEAESQIVNHLGQAYQVHERLVRQCGQLVQGIVQAIDLCESLEPTADTVRAVGCQLVGLLAGQGIAPWAPAAGEPLPEGCEVVGTDEAPGCPPGAVARVVAPGYCWQNGQIVRRARVTIALGAREDALGATAGSSPSQRWPEDRSDEQGAASGGRDDGPAGDGRRSCGAEEKE